MHRQRSATSVAQWSLYAFLALSPLIFIPLGGVTQGEAQEMFGAFLIPCAAVAMCVGISRDGFLRAPLKALAVFSSVAALLYVFTASVADAGVDPLAIITEALLGALALVTAAIVLPERADMRHAWLALGCGTFLAAGVDIIALFVSAPPFFTISTTTLYFVACVLLGAGVPRRYERRPEALSTLVLRSRRGRDRTLPAAIPAAWTVLAIALSLVVLRATVGAAALDRATYLTDSGDSAGAASALSVAAFLGEGGAAFERAHVELDLLELRALGRENSAPDTRTQMQALASDALAHGLSAVKNGGIDWRNWLELASLYQYLSSIGATNASENAKVAYQKALTLMPQ